MKKNKITAILGPTNTGKTFLAIETMLGFDSGMIGFPLRLLAREVYDKVIEKVDIKNRTVYINDILQEQGLGITNPQSDFPIILEENCIFVLGDNRNSSHDSRRFGCIPIENIDGQVAMRVWPLNKIKLYR